MSSKKTKPGDSPAAARTYRIGDFAKHLGVSAEFLKHYEENGLIDVVQKGGGYRYYAFEQSARVIEYLRLKNYGVRVREMREMLSLEPGAAISALDAKADELEAQVRRLTLLIEEHRRLSAWFEKRRQKPVDWEVRVLEPYCFLPHTLNKAFLDDERVYTILNDWNAWLPVTKSTLLVRYPYAGRPESLQWGFAVPEAILQRYGIPANASVMRLDFGRAFIYHFSSDTEAYKMSDILNDTHPAFRLLHSLGFSVRSDALFINEMKLTDSNANECHFMGRAIIPIE